MRDKHMLHVMSNAKVAPEHVLKEINCSCKADVNKDAPVMASIVLLIAENVLRIAPIKVKT